jgi:hypothetical protein
MMLSCRRGSGIGRGQVQTACSCTTITVASHQQSVRKCGQHLACFKVSQSGVFLCPAFRFETFTLSHILPRRLCYMHVLHSYPAALQILVRSSIYSLRYLQRDHHEPLPVTLLTLLGDGVRPAKLLLILMAS